MTSSSSFDPPQDDALQLASSPRTDELALDEPDDDDEADDDEALGLTQASDPAPAPLTLTVQASLAAEQRRLDVFLTAHTTLTRSQLRREVDEGRVLVNGALVKAGHKLRPGDLVRWSPCPPKPLALIPEAIPLDLLYQDEHLAVVNKPAGMVVHPSAGHDRGTLVHALLHHFKTLAPGSQAERPGIVHRIDKDTSGSLVITRTHEAHLHLSRLFATHTLTRRYHALVLDHGLADAGEFDTLHGRCPQDRMRFSGRVPRGKRALTRYRVLERFDQGVCLVECTLQTGRTHQIRMHFYEAGCPLLADALYGGRKSAHSALIDRQALHAHTLAFEHLDGRLIHTCAPYPQDFAQALERLRQGKRWR